MINAIVISHKTATRATVIASCTQSTGMGVMKAFFLIDFAIPINLCNFVS